MADVVKQSNYFEELAILVSGPDETQRLLRSKCYADFVGNIVVWFRDVGDQGVCGVYPRENGSIYWLAGCVIAIPWDKDRSWRGHGMASRIDDVRYEFIG